MRRKAKNWSKVSWRMSHYSSLKITSKHYFKTTFIRWYNQIRFPRLSSFMSISNLHHTPSRLNSPSFRYPASSPSRTWPTLTPRFRLSLPRTFPLLGRKRPATRYKAPRLYHLRYPKSILSSERPFSRTITTYTMQRLGHLRRGWA